MSLTACEEYTATYPPPKKAEMGWECPRCGTINAPWKDKCDCIRAGTWKITWNDQWPKTDSVTYEIGKEGPVGEIGDKE